MEDICLNLSCCKITTKFIIMPILAIKNRGLKPPKIRELEGVNTILP